MASNAWVSWEIQNTEVGSPFAFFPNGAPVGQIVCRWGESPDLPTDNVLDLAWAPIDSENAVAARQVLEERGCPETDGPEGTLLDAGGYEGGVCDAPWGGFYLFTDDDVRWAVSLEELARITPPEATG